jgi:hypothetical protein
MPDEFDAASEREQAQREEAIKSNAQPLPPGKPGECEFCGEWSGRLILAACAPCRERYRLP